MNARMTYVNTIHTLAANRPSLASVPEAISRNAWLRESNHVVLAISPSVGAFSDCLIEEDGGEPSYTREQWMALEPNIAWYAAYMDVLVNLVR
jgi:hypothetical protein